MTKTIVITGAGSGVGRATTAIFLKEGWNVALIGRRLDALEETANGHANAACYSADISDPVEVDKTFAEIVTRFGRIDALFNNAGRGSAEATPDKTDVQDWLDVVAVNLTGSFLCARAAFAQMRAQSPQGGRIINNGSISADRPRPGSIPYTSTKHAITGLTKTLSLDGRPFDIACGQIDIGNALTPLAERMTKGVTQANGTTATEDMMDVDHVGEAVLHMANLPLATNVQTMTIMATKMPFIGRG